MQNFELFLGGFATGAERVVATLDLNKSLLMDAGLNVPASKDVREHFTRPCSRIGDALDTAKEKPDPDDIATLTQWMEHHSQQTSDRFMIADAEMVGLPRHLAWRGLLYPKKDPFFAALKKAWATPPSTVFVGIQSYDHLFSQAWCAQMTDRRNDVFAPPRKTVASVSRRKPSWITFFRVLASLLPKTRIVAWRADDSNTAHTDALNVLLGADLASSLTAADPTHDQLTSMSQRAFDVYSDIELDSGMERAHAELDSIRAVYDRLYPHPSLSIFPQAASKKLAAQYQKDCDALAAISDPKFEFVSTDLKGSL